MLKLPQPDVAPPEKKLSFHIAGLTGFSSLQVRKRFAELLLVERDVAQIQVGARIVRRLLKGQE